MKAILKDENKSPVIPSTRNHHHYIFIFILLDNIICGTMLTIFITWGKVYNTYHKHISLIILMSSEALST